MDIAALSMEISHVNLANKVGVEVIKMAMDQVEQVGEQTIQLMESGLSAQPHLGSQLDIRM